VANGERDPKDGLISLLGAGAKVIVTRDEDLLVLEDPGIEITPRELLSRA
jgi:predicted nucleic acid-binding protein